MELLEYSNELIPESFYDSIILTDVKCCNCENILDKNEIISHRYVGIIEPREMQCTACWLTQSYESQYLF